MNIKNVTLLPVELHVEDQNSKSKMLLVIEKASKTISKKVGNARNYATYTDDQKTLLLTL